jgi:hypothetical protein
MGDSLRFTGPLEQGLALQKFPNDLSLFEYSRGGGTHKILSLKRLVQLHKPDVLFLQETMSTGDKVESLLRPWLRDWSFFSSSVEGMSGGLLIAWNSRVVCKILCIFPLYCW